MSANGKKYLKDQVPTLKIEKASDVVGFRLVDVRRDDEYGGELGHIKGAELVTLGPKLENFLQNEKNQAKKLDDPILFICRSGARSASATMLAQSMGFKEVYNMEGGMIYWNELKLPTEK